MSGEEGSLGEIRRVLAGITHRLDKLADAVGVAAAESPGALLDEATRAHLGGLASLLAIGRGTSASEAVILGLDRALSHGRADCAAIIRSDSGRRPVVVAHRGFRLPLEPDADAGILGRAIHAAELVQAGPGLGGRDTLLEHHGLGAALAIPIPDATGSPAGALLVGRRRPVPFETDTLGALVMVADRLASALQPPPDEYREEWPLSALFASLDPSRTAATVANEAAAQLRAETVAVLVPDGDDFALTGAAGLQGSARPPRGSSTLRTVAATRRPLVLSEAAGDDPELTRWLGRRLRAVVPLSVGDRLVALFAVGSSGLCGVGLSPAFEGAAALALRNASLHAESLRSLAHAPPSAPPPPDPSLAPLADMASILAVVLGRLAAVRERVTDPTATRDLSDAEEAVWRVAEGVRRVLGFGPGSRATPPMPIDLAALVRDAVHTTEALWAREGRAPTITLDLDPVPPVRVHPDEFRQVLRNLLQNAREACNEERPAEIAVRLRWDGGTRVEVSVADRGRGMDEATRARAGEPFFTTKGPGRLGVGLAVARAVAQRHRGELELETTPGQGTTVRLRVPTAGGAAAPSIHSEPVSRLRRRILVVDDDKIIRETLAQVLEHDGYEIDATGDVGDAITLLDRSRVDLVVTDLVLPGGSGLEVARAVKRTHPGTPVILVTGWPGQVDPETLANHGIDALVEKPVGLDTLRTTAATLIERGSPRSR